tara:strand:+ start:658 stop:960 length:303 start_codon:yes stop_codon:yes gene_type:complete
VLGLVALGWVVWRILALLLVVVPLLAVWALWLWVVALVLEPIVFSAGLDALEKTESAAFESCLGLWGGHGCGAKCQKGDGEDICELHVESCDCVVFEWDF